MMGLDGSPSKSYVSKFHGRSQLRKNFVQGALIGLTTIFLWTSLRLIWPKADSQSFSNTKQIPDNSKPSLVAFVGVQVVSCNSVFENGHFGSLVLANHTHVLNIDMNLDERF